MLINHLPLKLQKALKISTKMNDIKRNKWHCRKSTTLKAVFFLINKTDKPLEW